MKMIVFKKLTQGEAIKTIIEIKKWFAANPRRKICRTECFTVRRSRIEDDIYEHTESFPASNYKRETKRGGKAKF